MSDIVERARAYARNCGGPPEEYLTWQLADEVDRLRGLLQSQGTSYVDHIHELSREIERLKAALREAYDWIQPQSYCTAPMEWEERAKVAKAIRTALEGKT